MRQTNNPDFSTVSENLSVPIISEEKLRSVQNYQNQLINFLLYERSGVSGATLKNNRILKEIQETEVWLKKYWKLFINNYKDARTKTNYRQ